MCTPANRHSRPGKELNDQSLKLWESCTLDDTMEAIMGIVHSVITKIRGRWSKFKDLKSVLTSRVLPKEPKGRLYFARVCSVMLYGGDAWLVKEEDAIVL